MAPGKGHKLRHNMAHTRCILDKQGYTQDYATPTRPDTHTDTHAHKHTQKNM